MNPKWPISYAVECVCATLCGLVWSEWLYQSRATVASDDSTHQHTHTQALWNRFLQFFELYNASFRIYRVDTVAQTHAATRYCLPDKQTTLMESTVCWMAAYEKCFLCVWGFFGITHPLYVFCFQPTDEINGTWHPHIYFIINMPRLYKHARHLRKSLRRWLIMFSIWSPSLAFEPITGDRQVWAW